MAKYTDKELHKKAVKIVRREDDESTKERIKEVYQELLHESQKVRASKEKLKEIRSVYQKSKQLHRRGLGDGYQLCNFVEFPLEMYLKTKKYHPKEYEGLKKYVETRSRQQAKTGY